MGVIFQVRIIVLLLVLWWNGRVWLIGRKLLLLLLNSELLLEFWVDVGLVKRRVVRKVSIRGSIEIFWLVGDIMVGVVMKKLVSGYCWLYIFG